MRHLVASLLHSRIPCCRLLSQACMADNKRQVPSDYKRARKKRTRRDSTGMAGRDGSRISEVIDLTGQDDDIPTSRPKITKTINLADSLADIPMPPGKPPQTTSRLPDRDRPVDSQPTKPNLAPVSQPSISRRPQSNWASMDVPQHWHGPPPGFLQTQQYHTNSHGLSGRAQEELADWNNLRRWDPTRAGRDLDSLGLGQAQIRVRLLSYNVLAQNLLQGHPYLYRDCPRESLDWSYRWAGLRREVDQLQPDVVCLQEVQFDSPDYFSTCYLPFFSTRGYKHVAKARTGDKQDGCVIFFRSSMFALDTVSEMEYKIPRVSVLDRDNVGLVCRLTPLQQPCSPLVVATTHLLYNPKRDDIRLAQIALLLAEVDRLATPPSSAASSDYLPTILTGDLNADPTSPVFQLLATGSVQYAGQRNRGGRALPSKLLPDALGLSDSCQWQVKLDQRGQGSSFQVGSGGFHHSLGLRSVYPMHPGVSTFQDGWTLVDYIFHSSSPRMQLAAKLRLPTAHQLARSSKLPSLVCPSDHLPLVADFLLSP